MKTTSMVVEIVVGGLQTSVWVILRERAKQTSNIYISK